MQSPLDFPEMWSLIASFMDEETANVLIASVPEHIDPNKIILYRLKEGHLTLPFSLYVNGKLRSFDNFSEARDFVSSTYKMDIYPHLVNYIRKNGTNNKSTSPVSYSTYYVGREDRDIPYGFRYFLGKSIFSDTPAVSVAEIWYKFPKRKQSEDEEDDEEKEAFILTEYINRIPLLPLVLKRGDLIFNNRYGGDRNEGVSIWDGEKVVPLSREVILSESPCVPSQFKTLTEFPFGYFQADYGFMGINHNNIQWMDLSSYAEQAKENFVDHGPLERSSHINVKEMADGKERTIRINLETEEDLTAEDFKQIVLKNKFFEDTLSSYGSNERSITLSLKEGEEE